ncbi:hypothetical protein TRAPUB_13851 [Trametes pubescens]|uniref:Uncharacterized protein n=1 Tax=Trametes pubescens TaxID=154538 RepID=A0A1M2VQ01_TRAPU|nr:hypothetical protein TRAPUB_13851 [Trametes pubescens]
MNIPAGRYLCVCSKCRLLPWYDSDHHEYRGRLWKTAETVSKHQELDEVRKQQYVEKNESGVAAAIIREIAGGSVEPATSLPVRPRDHADWIQETPVQRTEGNRERIPISEIAPSSVIEDANPNRSDLTSSSTGEVSDATSPTSIPQMRSESPVRTDLMQQRLQQLGLIESLLHAQRRNIPIVLNLRFASPPTNITDIAPEIEGTEGDNGRYLSIQSTLLEQLRQLRQLIPLDDRNLDRHRERLINTAEEHLRLLENKKHTAWEEEIVRVTLQRLSPDAGPVVISPSEG